jgi:hypothetical protein
LDSSSFSKMSDSQISSFYAQSWLLVHFLGSDDDLSEWATPFILRLQSYPGVDSP